MRRNQRPAIHHSAALRTAGWLNVGLEALYAVVVAAETAAVTLSGYKDWSEFDAACLAFLEKVNSPLE